jgi:hypothetical protein
VECKNLYILAVNSNSTRSGFSVRYYIGREEREERVCTGIDFRYTPLRHFWFYEPLPAHTVSAAYLSANLAARILYGMDIHVGIAARYLGKELVEVADTSGTNT